MKKILGEEIRTQISKPEADSDRNVVTEMALQFMLGIQDGSTICVGDTGQIGIDED